jgi:hypothetical protein
VGEARLATRENGSFPGTSSFACLAEIQRKLRPEAVSVESQPPDVVPRYANATWWRREADVPVLPLSGLRSSVYAAAAVSALKRRHCAVFGCGPYDLVVRLRPDLYLLKGKEWQHESLPHTRAWPVILDSARRGAMLGGGALNDTVFACGSGRLPGDKSTDACFWSGDGTMERVIHMWNAIAPAWLDNNFCWYRWRVLRSPRPPPPVDQCGPAANCSNRWGCLVEHMLAHAIELVGASRGLASNATPTRRETVYRAELQDEVRVGQWPLWSDADANRRRQ